MVELQQNYQKVKSAGLGLAAISYDSPAVLKNFAERKSIQFPLLSDANSEIIRRFDILNPGPRERSTSYGIPYPGTYVLDAKGVVTAKYFEDDYKERDTAAVILMKKFGLQTDAPRVSINAKHLQLGTSVSDHQTAAGWHLALILDVKLADHVHVYAPGVKGYIPIDWELTPSAAIRAEPATFPKSEILRLEAIQESVPVYEGEFQLIREITIESEQTVVPLLDTHGDLIINGTFRYQACDDQKCFLPEIVPVQWTVRFQRHDRARVPEDMQRKEHSKYFTNPSGNCHKHRAQSIGRAL